MSFSAKRDSFQTKDTAQPPRKPSKKYEQTPIETIIKVRPQLSIDKRTDKIFKDADKKEDDRLNNYSQKVKDEVNSINFKEKDVPGVPENFPELMFEPNDEDVNNPDDTTIQSNDAFILGYVDMPERIRGAYNIKKIKKEDLLEDIVLNRLDALKRPLALKSVSYQKEELYTAKINPIGKSEINLRAKSLALSLIRKMHVEEAKNKLIGKVSTIKSCMFALYFIIKNLKSESDLVVNTDSPVENRDQEDAKSVEEKQDENNANMPRIENGKMITSNYEIDIQGLTAYLSKFKEIERLKKVASAKL